VRPPDSSIDPPEENSSDREQDGSQTNPAGICHGAGLMVIYGNPAFKRVFGEGSVGLPAREGMLGLSRTGFALMDAVLDQGRPLARWVRLTGETWRMTAVPRIELDTGEVFGVSFHLSPKEPGSRG
jgi:hypothetical protein